MREYLIIARYSLVAFRNSLRKWPSFLELVLLIFLYFLAGYLSYEYLQFLGSLDSSIAVAERSSCLKYNGNAIMFVVSSSAIIASSYNANMFNCSANALLCGPLNTTGVFLMNVFPLAVNPLNWLALGLFYRLLNAFGVHDRIATIFFMALLGSLLIAIRLVEFDQRTSSRRVEESNALEMTFLIVIIFVIISAFAPHNTSFEDIFLYILPTGWLMKSISAYAGNDLITAGMFSVPFIIFFVMIVIRTSWDRQTKESLESLWPPESVPARTTVRKVKPLERDYQKSSPDAAIAMNELRIFPFGFVQAFALMSYLLMNASGGFFVESHYVLLLLFVPMPFAFSREKAFFRIYQGYPVSLERAYFIKAAVNIAYNVAVAIFIAAFMAMLGYSIYSLVPNYHSAVIFFLWANLFMTDLYLFCTDRNTGRVIARLTLVVAFNVTGVILAGVLCFIMAGMLNDLLFKVIIFFLALHAIIHYSTFSAGVD